jgi:hypothetical protein
MALASRSARRGSAGRRWLLIGVVITLFVLLIDASLQSRSPGPGQELAAGAWIDRALPVVTTSTEEGQQLAATWSNGLQTPATSLSSQLDQIASGSHQAYEQIVALHPPANVAGAAGLLEACLLARSEGATALRDALRPVLLSGNTASPQSNGPDPTLSAIQTAGNDLLISDQAYRLFVQSLPNLGVTLPASTWAGNPSPYQPATAQVFLTSLRNALSTTPIHQVKIYSISTSPPPVSTQNGIEVLPVSSAMSVTVVVADTGNQPESGLTVTASISSSGSSSSVRDFVDLQPGQARTVEGMGPLNPAQGVPVELSITLTPSSGSGAATVTQTLQLIMPNGGSATSSTVPGGSTSTTSGSSTTTTPAGTTGT